jgi:hypothetical protein
MFHDFHDFFYSGVWAKNFLQQPFYFEAARRDVLGAEARLNGRAT